MATNETEFGTEEMKVSIQEMVLQGPNQEDEKDLVERIKFAGTKGEEFTWKPKIPVTEKFEVNGFTKESKTTRPARISELPPLIGKINNALENGNVVPIKAEFGTAKTETKKGNLRKFYFIKSKIETFKDKIELLKPLDSGGGDDQ